MAIAYDATSEVTGFATPDPLTTTHTPSGTPAAVAVVIGHVTGSDAYDATVGDVTYGGTSLARTARAQRTTGETGSVAVYFLGASVATGAQTVSWNHAGSTGGHWMVTVTYTASGDCEVKSFGVINDTSQANPQLTLDSGTANAMRLIGIFSGLADTTDLTLLSGQTAVHSEDYGSYVLRCDRETSTSSGSTTVGYTGVADDVAMVGAAFGEISGSVAETDLSWRLSVTTGPGDSTAQTDPDASLGEFVSQTEITDRASNNLFDDITGAENAASDVEYRCIFLCNTSTTATWSNIKVWILAESSNGASHAIALDGTGVVDIDSASAQAEEEADESTAPSGESFTSPTTKSSGLSITSLGPEQCQAIWVRRTANDTAALTDAILQLRAEGDT